MCGEISEGNGSEALVLSSVIEVLPVSWVGVALILLALVLFVVDLLVTNHGLPAIWGVVALILGVLVLFEPAGPYLWASLVILVVVVVLTGALFVGGLSEALSARGRPVTTGMEGMIGEVGVVREPVGPSLPGWVFVHGERWQAIAAVAPEDAHEQDQERTIEVGRRVQVVGLRDGKVIVLPERSSKG